MKSAAYLDPRFVGEPLVLSWYGWPHLLSPATAALTLKRRLIPILKSYIDDPDVHTAAVNDPRMLGGPFADFPQTCVDSVRALLRRTLRDGSDLLSFASGLEALQKLVGGQGGGPLAHLYEQVPSALKGYVELVYDLANHPSFRIKESLLLRGAKFPALAGELAPLLVSTPRRFALSTPRLDGPRLKVPLRDPRIDDLYRAYRAPVWTDALAEKLELDTCFGGVFSGFFTQRCPAPHMSPAAGTWRVRYLGHASVLVETHAVAVLFDPVLRVGEYEMPGFSILDLPEHIDYVVLTHNHQDHVLVETLLQIRHRTGTIVVPRSAGGLLQDPSLALILRELGFGSVCELGELEELSIPGGLLIGLPFFGEHGDLDILSKLGYLLRLGSHSLALLADSNNLEPTLYQHLRLALGPVDTLFVGLECEGAPVSWLYGPYFPESLERHKDQARRLTGSDSRAALDIVTRLSCQRAYVYAMGLEPWVSHVSAVRFDPLSRPIQEARQFVDSCAERGVEARMLYGGTTLIEGPLA